MLVVAAAQVAPVLRVERGVGVVDAGVDGAEHHPVPVAHGPYRGMYPGNAKLDGERNGGLRFGREQGCGLRGGVGVRLVAGLFDHVGYVVAGGKLGSCRLPRTKTALT